MASGTYYQSCCFYFFPETKIFAFPLITNNWRSILEFWEFFCGTAAWWQEFPLIVSVSRCQFNLQSPSWLKSLQRAQSPHVFHHRFTNWEEPFRAQRNFSAKCVRRWEMALYCVQGCCCCGHSMSYNCTQRSFICQTHRVFCISGILRTEN